MAGISATAQEKVKQGFSPLLAGFTHLPFNDLQAVKNGLTSETVGILIEPDPSLLAPGLGASATRVGLLAGADSGYRYRVF